MIVPAAIYLSFNIGTPRAAGWGIPMATDIVFALGVLALLGNRIPPGLKVFLAALAIADDIGAVAVISLFYGSELIPFHLAIAFAYVTTLAVANRMGVRNPLPYALVGIAGVWHCFFLSGVHPTVAGIVWPSPFPRRNQDPPVQDRVRSGASRPRGAHG
jgi:NhaA family Na+:H+ antiporter